MFPLSACSDEENVGNNNNTSTVIYAAESQPVNNAYISSNVSQIERISPLSDEGQYVLSKLKSNSQISVSLDDSHIEKTSYFDSDVVTYSLRDEGTLNTYLIVYRKGNAFKFALSSFEQVSNKIERFTLRDLQGQLIYSVSLKEDRTIGNRKVGKGNLDIGKDGDVITLNNDEDDEDSDDGESCPESTDAFSECMACGLNECTQDWQCAVLGMVSPQNILIGFSIGCAFG